MKTIRTVVLIMEVSECRIQWKSLEKLSLGKPVYRQENNSNFELHSSRVKNPRILDLCCPETSVRNYHYSLRNNPEQRSYQLLRGGSLQSPRIIEDFREMIKKVRGR